MGGWAKGWQENMERPELRLPCERSHWLAPLPHLFTCNRVYVRKILDVQTHEKADARHMTYKETCGPAR